IETVWFNNRTTPYAEMSQMVAKQIGVPCIDLYSTIEKLAASAALLEKRGEYQKYLKDGIHLTMEENQVVYQLIRSTIQPHWPEIMPLN
ncbi:hypothetical protein H4S01_004850, partial [Coemansia sp. RSA 2610]